MRKPNRSPLLKRVKKLTTATVCSPIRRVPLPPRESRLNAILNRNKEQKMENDKLNEIMAKIDHPITEVDTEPFEISTINDDKMNSLANSIQVNGKKSGNVVTQNITVHSAMTENVNHEDIPTESEMVSKVITEQQSEGKPEEIITESIATNDISEEQSPQSKLQVHEDTSAAITSEINDQNSVNENMSVMENTEDIDTEKIKITENVNDNDTEKITDNNENVNDNNEIVNNNNENVNNNNEKVNDNNEIVNDNNDGSEIIESTANEPQKLYHQLKQKIYQNQQ